MQTWWLHEPVGLPGTAGTFALRVTPLPYEVHACFIKGCKLGTQKCMPQKNSRRKAYTHNSQNNCWRFILNIDSILMWSCQCVKRFSCSVYFPTPDLLLAGNGREARISRTHIRPLRWAQWKIYQASISQNKVYGSCKDCSALNFKIKNWV